MEHLTDPVIITAGLLSIIIAAFVFRIVLQADTQVRLLSVQAELLVKIAENAGVNTEEIKSAINDNLAKSDKQRRATIE